MLAQNGKADRIPEQGFTVDQLRQALGNESDSAGVVAEAEQQPAAAVRQQQEDVQPNKKMANEHKYGIADLFRTARLRNRTINICLNW